MQTRDEIEDELARLSADPAPLPAEPNVVSRRELIRRITAGLEDLDSSSLAAIGDTVLDTHVFFVNVDKCRLVDS